MGVTEVEELTILLQNLIINGQRMLHLLVVKKIREFHCYI